MTLDVRDAGSYIAEAVHPKMLKLKDRINAGIYSCVINMYSSELFIHAVFPASGRERETGKKLRRWASTG